MNVIYITDVRNQKANQRRIKLQDSKDQLLAFYKATTPTATIYCFFTGAKQ